MHFPVEVDKLQQQNNWFICWTESAIFPLSLLLWPNNDFVNHLNRNYSAKGYFVNPINMIQHDTEIRTTIPGDHDLWRGCMELLPDIFDKLGLQIIVQKGKDSFPVWQGTIRQRVSTSSSSSRSILFDKSALFLTPSPTLEFSRNQEVYCSESWNYLHNFWQFLWNISRQKRRAKQKCFQVFVCCCWLNVNSSCVWDLNWRTAHPKNVSCGNIIPW